MRTSLRRLILGGLLLGAAQASTAVTVDLELILGQDVSGSIEDADFALSRSGIAAAFSSPAVIAAIQAGTIGSIAVTLWDFANTTSVAVPWMVISDATSANAFAAAVAAATRNIGIGSNDGQSNLINQALAALRGNDFAGTRSVLDIASEGAQDIDGCTFDNVACTTVQTARDAFLAGGGTAINAIWLNDRDFFGLDATDLINAYEYGSLNVIGGPGSFQTFAQDFTAFQDAIQAKLLREINPAPTPGVLPLMAAGLLALGFGRRWKRA